MSALVALIALAFGRLLDRAWFGNPGGGHGERFGRGLTFGFAGLGLLSMLVDVARLGVGRMSLGSAVSAAVALSLWRLRARTSAPDAVDASAHEPLSPKLRAACIGMGLLTTIALLLQLRTGWIRPTYQFDALTRWMFKAKALHVEGTLFGTLTYDEAFGFTHQRYPPLISHLANLPALISGHFDDYQASALFPWFAVALVCLCAGTLTRLRGALAGSIAGVWLANLPLIAFISVPPPGAGSWSAMADIPLALFVAAAGLALYAVARSERPLALAELGFVAAAAALTKNEGLPLLAGIGLACLFAGDGPRLRRALLVVGAAALVFVLLWGHAIPGIPALDEDYHGQLTADRLGAGVDRLGLILFGTQLPGLPPFKGLLPELINFRNWNLTWPLVLMLVVSAGRAAWRRPMLALWLLVLVQISAYVGAYMVTVWSSPNARAIVGADGDPLGFLLNLTLGRLLMHVAPLAICAGLLAAPRTQTRSG